MSGWHTKVGQPLFVRPDVMSDGLASSSSPWQPTLAAVPRSRHLQSNEWWTRRLVVHLFIRNFVLFSESATDRGMRRRCEKRDLQSGSVAQWTGVGSGGVVLSPAVAGRLTRGHCFTVSEISVWHGTTALRRDDSVWWRMINTHARDSVKTGPLCNISLDKM